MAASDGRVGWVAAAGAGAGLLWPQLPPPAFTLALLVSALLLLAGRRGRLPGLAVLALCLAHLHAGHVLQRQWPAAGDGQTVWVTGRVEGLVTQREGYSRFRLRVDGDAALPPALRDRRLQLGWGAVGLPTSDEDAARLQLQPGQHWRLPVRIYRPRSLHNPGGFDAARHALAERIHAQGQVQVGMTPERLHGEGGLDAWRAAISARIDQSMDPAQARFIRALTLGDTGALVQGDWEMLRRTGLTHLVAISGFHVGLLGVWAAWCAGLVWRVLPGLGRRLPRPQAMAVAALLGAGLYALAAGMELPAVRSLLMIAVVVLARLSRRVVGIGQCLGLALLAMVLVDPLALLSAGFWLSFAGVAWLAWSLPHGRQPLVRGLLTAQAVATLGLLPLTVLLFGQASLIGPLVNLVAIPWWSLVVVPLCVLGLLLEAVLPGTGGVPWWLAGQAFDPSWQLFMWLGSSELALWWLPQAGLTATLLALCGAAVVLLPRGVPGRWLGGVLVLPLLMPARELARSADGVELIVLDVGQGLSVVVRTAGHVLLYDTGPRSRGGFDAGERIVLPALRALGVRRLDGVLLSHGDADHAGGLSAVQAGLPVGWVGGPGGMAVPVQRRCVAGQGWQWDGVDFRLLHPPPFFPYLGNDASCVLRIGTVHGAVLLTGDISQLVEQRLLRDQPAALRAQVVVVPHHGSDSSSLGGLVQATAARLAVVSRGHGNRFGHPSARVVARWQHAGAEVLDTATGGAVRIWLDQDGLHVRQYRFWHRRLWHGGG